jgi:MFS transporter, PAT family, beta-lactamase induction signal transducer AmpG
VDVVRAFFAKPGIWLGILFILLFRLAEGQVQTIGPLFLRDARALGGLGLSTQEVGAIYGTAGTAAFLVGSILGGWFTSRVGLARAMLTLILAMNVPNLVFWYLGTAQPSDLGLVTAALSAEMFGYGFGFVGMILYIMQAVAPGRFQTAHYALGSGVMQLGFIFAKFISGDIQVSVGYQHFFAWTMGCGLLPLLLLLWVPMPRAAKPAEGVPA